MDARDEGIVVGLLIGEGSFGGDGKQPQVTLRMHVRHGALMRWLTDRFPGSRLYGPYHHGNRHYFQWMSRGDALVAELLPILEAHVTPELDAHARGGRMIPGRGLERQVLDGVDRLPVAADEQPQIVALELGPDLPALLGDVDRRLERQRFADVLQ